MLFRVKCRLDWTLLTASAFAALAIAGGALARDWRWDGRAWLLAGLLIGSSDGLFHLLLTARFGDEYLRRWHCLAWQFAGQGLPEIAGGALLAGSEELLFRGVLLHRLSPAIGALPALALTAALFGLAHHLPQRPLRGFTLWAIWEGVLLGLVYLWSGSLLVTALVHATHDLLGFALFAVVRR